VLNLLPGEHFHDVPPPCPHIFFPNCTVRHSQSQSGPVSVSSSLPLIPTDSD
jgi:hypothetical protein